MSIKQDAAAVVRAMAEYGQGPGDSQIGRYSFTGDKFRELLRWEPERINDAVELLRTTDWLEVLDYLGCFPYSFSEIQLTAAGRSAAQESAVAPTPPPIASPHTNGDDDRRFAEVAIVESRRCVSEGHKISPMVGAVVVKDGKLLATAYRGEVNPGQHAEYIALEVKLGKETLAGSTVYTTLEPCTTRNHPKVPCAEWLIDRKVARVVIGMLDPDPRISGKRQRLLRHANIRTDMFDNELMAQVEELNRAFTRSQQGHLTATGTAALQPALATPAKADLSATLPEKFDWMITRNFLHGELVHPVVYKSSRQMKFNIRLRTIQRLPPGISIRKWKVTKILMDGEETDPSVIFEERVVSIAEVGVTEFGEDVKLKIPDHMLDRPQLTISAQLYMEAHTPEADKVLLSLEERYARMCT